MLVPSPYQFPEANMASSSVLICAVLFMLMIAPSMSQNANGQATYYGPAYTPSACYGFDTSQFPKGPLIAAASPDIFKKAAPCGSFFEITCKGAVSGSGGCKSNPTVKVKVVDLCPGCHANSFDLSKEAFSRIANPDVGRIKIFSRKVSGDCANDEIEEGIAMTV